MYEKSNIFNFIKFTVDYRGTFQLEEWKTIEIDEF